MSETEELALSPLSCREQWRAPRDEWVKTPHRSSRFGASAKRKRAASSGDTARMWKEALGKSLENPSALRRIYRRWLSTVPHPARQTRALRRLAAIRHPGNEFKQTASAVQVLLASLFPRTEIRVQDVPRDWRTLVNEAIKTLAIFDPPAVAVQALEFATLDDPEVVETALDWVDFTLGTYHVSQPGLSDALAVILTKWATVEPEAVEHAPHIAGLAAKCMLRSKSPTQQVTGLIESAVSPSLIYAEMIFSEPRLSASQLLEIAPSAFGEFKKAGYEETRRTAYAVVLRSASEDRLPIESCGSALAKLAASS